MAVLNVEGEILDRDITGGLEHAVAEPGHRARVRHDHVRVDRRRVVRRVRVVVSANTVKILATGYKNIY